MCQAAAEVSIASFAAHQGSHSIRHGREIYAAMVQNKAAAVNFHLKFTLAGA
jgi:hypothetical protein